MPHIKIIYHGIVLSTLSVLSNHISIREPLHKSEPYKHLRATTHVRSVTHLRIFFSSSPDHLVPSLPWASPLRSQSSKRHRLPSKQSVARRSLSMLLEATLYLLCLARQIRYFFMLHEMATISFVPYESRMSRSTRRIVYLLSFAR